MKQVGEVSVDPVNDDSIQPKKLWRFRMVILILLLCTFLSAIDATILATALPAVAQDLHGTSILAFWCATSYLLAKTVVQPGYPPQMKSNRSMGQHVRNLRSQAYSASGYHCLRHRLHSLRAKFIDGHACCQQSSAGYRRGRTDHSRGSHNH